MVKDALIMSPPNTQEEQLSSTETIAREVESEISHVQGLTPKEDHMRGPLDDDTGKQNAVSGNSDKITNPHPRLILEEFINLPST
jgi:hypothetical protein